MHRRDDDPIIFRCNICSQENEVPLARLNREEPSCSRCGSTVRARSIIQVLTTELFGRSLRIDQIGRSGRGLTGIGMSCWDGYAMPLSRRLSYTNTFYHQKPRLDITHIDPAMEGTLDFVISTDVFEHVVPPISSAFHNVRRLLKPNGVFVFSVPFSHPGGEPVPTLEHFPDLRDYEIEARPEGRRLRNTTRSGETQYFDDLVFHGGVGSTLEMRVFTEWSIGQELANAGFDEITICSGSDLRHGVYWADKWSVPFSARMKAVSNDTKAASAEHPEDT
ncbi:MAG TPA: class I SAM-dependent methyltransferase [Rhodanobacteraceae bacterium]|nr:class I SAM-dependent methyltransferase [Rhodanobacteraceae bacterium]